MDESNIPANGEVHFQALAAELESRENPSARNVLSNRLGSVMGTWESLMTTYVDMHVFPLVVHPPNSYGDAVCVPRSLNIMKH